VSHANDSVADRNDIPDFGIVDAGGIGADRLAEDRRTQFRRHAGYPRRVRARARLGPKECVVRFSRLLLSCAAVFLFLLLPRKLPLGGLARVQSERLGSGCARQGVEPG
jgi:hypothetical protein